MRNPKLSNLLLPVAALMMLAGCGGAEQDQPTPDESATTATVAPAGLARTASPDGASVFFISPANGDTLSNPIIVEFGISGMSLVKAGEMAANAGHHHLIIDADLPEMGLPVPKDEHYRHFGDASSVTELTLAPGPHTLQLLLADHLHIPHDPPVFSETITITVE